MVEYLLATNSVEVDVRDVAGKTPLFCAAEGGFTDIMRLLLDYGAQWHYRDENGRTPLLIAEANGMDDAVALLEEHEAATQER